MVMTSVDFIAVKQIVLKCLILYVTSQTNVNGDNVEVGDLR